MKNKVYVLHDTSRLWKSSRLAQENESQETMYKISP